MVKDPVTVFMLPSYSVQLFIKSKLAVIDKHLCIPAPFNIYKGRMWRRRVKCYFSQSNLWLCGLILMRCFASFIRSTHQLSKKDIMMAVRPNCCTKKTCIINALIIQWEWLFWFICCRFYFLLILFTGVCLVIIGIILFSKNTPKKKKKKRNKEKSGVLLAFQSPPLKSLGERQYC